MKTNQTPLCEKLACGAIIIQFFFFIENEKDLDLKDAPENGHLVKNSSLMRRGNKNKIFSVWLCFAVKGTREYKAVVLKYVDDLLFSKKIRKVALATLAMRISILFLISRSRNISIKQFSTKTYKFWNNIQLTLH